MARDNSLMNHHPAFRNSSSGVISCMPIPKESEFCIDYTWTYEVFIVSNKTSSTMKVNQLCLRMKK